MMARYKILVFSKSEQHRCDSKTSFVPWRNQQKLCVNLKTPNTAGSVQRYSRVLLTLCLMVTFSIGTSNAGTIAGIVSQAGNQVPISGALVELLQSNAVILLTRTAVNGSYSIAGLSGTYDVRVSSTNFAAHEELGISVGSETNTTVDFSLVSVPGLEVHINSPSDGGVVERPQIWVFGQGSAPASISDITVNGEPAQIGDGAFGTIVQLQAGSNAITAFLVDLAGNVAIDTRMVVRQAPTAPNFVAIWDGLKGALRTGNINNALEFIINKSKAGYEEIFNALSLQLSEIDQILTDISAVEVRSDDAEFAMTRSGRSFYIHFAKDDDGIWKLAAF